MPYFLILFGTILISIGIWMLQKAKEPKQPVPIETVEQPKPKVETKASNKEKGDAFEKFVVSRFNKEYFSLKQWQGDKFHQGRFAEANLHPDLLLEFQLRDIKEPFAVECKWRSHISDPFEWAEARQIENYFTFQTQTKLPVFVVLGIGGLPSRPESVYVAPLQDLKERKLTREFLASIKRVEASHNFFYDARNHVLR